MTGIPYRLIPEDVRDPNQAGLPGADQRTQSSTSSTFSNGHQAPAAGANEGPSVEQTGTPWMPVIHNTINNAVTTNVIVEHSNSGPGLLTSVLWFLFIGSWASFLWITIAWLLILFVITMPIGLMMLNVVPKIATLKEPARELKVTVEGTTTRIQHALAEQHPFWVRALYFVFAGCWLSLVWVYVAWVASITLVGLPLAIWMYNRVPAVTTLKRY